MRQDFLQFSRCFHHSLLLETNLESQIQKPKSASRRKCDPAHALTCITLITSVFEKCHDRRRFESLSAYQKLQLNQKLRLYQILPSVSNKRTRHISLSL